MVLGTRNVTLINEVQAVYLKTVRESSLTEFQKLYTTFSKTNFSFSGKINVSGPLYKVKLDCYYPGSDENKLLEIADLVKEEYSIKLQLTNGSIVEISSFEEPLELSFSTTKNQTKFTFSGEKTTGIAPTTLQVLPSNNFPYKFPIKF